MPQLPTFPMEKHGHIAISSLLGNFCSTIFCGNIFLRAYSRRWDGTVFVVIKKQEKNSSDRQKHRIKQSMTLVYEPFIQFSVQELCRGSSRKYSITSFLDVNLESRYLTTRMLFLPLIPTFLLLSASSGMRAILISVQNTGEG